jgi:hypothetical protein
VAEEIAYNEISIIGDKIMYLKPLRVIVIALLLLGTAYATVAQAGVGGGEEGGNAQTPVQVIVQIAVTAMVLRGLKYFKLP